MSRPGRIFATMVALSALAVAGGPGTWASFSAGTSTAGNRATAGTVDIADNDGGATAMLSFSGALPGATDSGCIKVSYSGSLGSSVRLYGTTAGSGLDQYIDLKITRGRFTGSDPSFDACTGFEADAADYVGAGAGVMYSGTLQAFPDDYANGLIDPHSTSPESWSAGESHVYKLEVTLRSDTAAQGKDATQSFTWEARNQ